MSRGDPIRLDVARRRWARRLAASVESSDAEESGSLVFAVAANVAAAVGVEPAALGLSPNATIQPPDPPGGWGSPWLLGLVHEQAVSDQSRRGRGAWYTPEPVVRGLVALATEAMAAPEVGSVVLDPTCGGGAFLLAAADRLVGLGLSPATALNRLAGMDIDAGAVETAELSLRLWAAMRGLDPTMVELDLEVGDALSAPADRWASHRLVVGNPPFGSPLRSGALPETATRFRQEHAEHLGPYADLAAIHLLKALLDSGPESVVALVQPQSVLATQDTAALRSLIEEGRFGWLEALWVARESVFDAGVKTCAPVIGPRDPGVDGVRLAHGLDVTSRGQAPTDAWGSLAVRALGAPQLPPMMTERSHGQPLAPGLSATAGFRDEYYGLVAACREMDAEDDGSGSIAPLLTVGLVDPLTNLWGLQPCRFGRTEWQRPVIDRSELSDKVERWVERQSVPKVILATQSKVLEPVVDLDGSLIPATPLIAVHCPADRLGHVAAVLLAPPVVAWAWARWFGTALTVEGVKLAAKHIVELPTPPDTQRWDQAAALVVEQAKQAADRQSGRAVTLEVARIMNQAYGGDGALLEWWEARLPRLDR